MLRILVNPGKLRSLGASFQVNSENIYTLATQLRNVTNTLDWETRCKSNLDDQVNHACNQARNLAAQLQELSSHLKTKAQAFEDADRQGVEGLRVLDGSIKRFNESFIYDWFKYYTSLKNVPKMLKLISSGSWREIGRLINLLIGNKRGGWVGRMDDISGFFKSPWMKILPVIGIGFGVWGDLRSGDGWCKALVSEGLETGIYFIPVVGQAAAGYGLALGIGQLGLGIVDYFGGYVFAAKGQQVLEGLNFVERLTDGIYDFATQDPVGFASLLLTPPQFQLFHPGYQQFVKSFWSDTFRDFGWDEGAVFVENSFEAIDLTDRALDYV